MTRAREATRSPSASLRTRVVVLAAVAAILAAAWSMRAFARTALDGRTLAAESASDYRLRLVELTLASAHVPRHDRFLDPPAGTSTPWPPFFHAAVAVVARASLARADGDAALVGVDEPRLEALASRVAPALGTVATLAIALAVLAFHGARRRVGAALAAAALYAFLPTIVASEAFGRLDAHAWMTLCLAAQLVLAVWMLRARTFTDLALSAMVGGLVSGIALLSGPEALLAAVLAPVATIAHARITRARATRDAWRAALLFGAVVFAIATISEPGAGARRFAPEPRPWGQSIVDGTASAWLAPALFLLAWSSLVRLWREPQRLILLSFGGLGFVAALCDARFASAFHVAVVLTAAVACAENFGFASARPRTITLAFVVALVLSIGSSLVERGPPDASVRREAWIAGLRWMREQTPSAGPFNHASASGEWSVLSVPSAAGSIAYRARRPASCSSIASMSPSPPAVEALHGLAGADADRLQRGMRERDVSLLVVSPILLDDPGFQHALAATGVAERESLLARLSLAEPGTPSDPPSGFVLLHASTARCARDGGPARADAPSGPVISIYALAGNGADERRESMRAR